MPVPVGRSRPWTDHRLAVEGMAWKYRTGAPWRDVPELGHLTLCALVARANSGVRKNRHARVMRGPENGPEAHGPESHLPDRRSPGSRRSKGRVLNRVRTYTFRTTHSRTVTPLAPAPTARLDVVVEGGAVTSVETVPLPQIEVPIWARRNNGGLRRGWQRVHNRTHFDELVTKLDGDLEPWVVFDRGAIPADGGRWCQAIGAPDPGLVVEIGTARGPMMAGREDGPYEPKRAMPAQCPHWVTSAWPNELWDAVSASA